MDLWSLLEDEKSYALEQLDFEQAFVRKSDGHENGFSINRELINSKAYRDKFDQLLVSKNIADAIYRQAGRLLEFVDKQGEERLLAINSRTGEFIVDNFKRTGYIKSTGFSPEEMKCIDACPDNLILLHNHSLNTRPSATDLLTFLHEDKVDMSVIACHDGTIYAICGVQPKFELIFNSFLQKRLLQQYNEDAAQCIAMSDTILYNDKKGNRHKLFDVRRL